MHATDVVGYSFEADLFCPSCMRKKAALENESNGDNAEFAPLDTLLARWAKRQGIEDLEDEESYDSNDFPKAIMCSADLGCDRCISCGDHLMGDDCITYPHKYASGLRLMAICQNGRCRNVGQGDPCGDGDCLWHPDNPENPYTLGTDEDPESCEEFRENGSCVHSDHMQAAGL